MALEAATNPQKKKMEMSVMSDLFFNVERISGKNNNYPFRQMGGRPFFPVRSVNLEDKP